MPHSAGQPYEPLVIASRLMIEIIYGVRRNGSCPAKDFVDGLESRKRLALLAFLCEAQHSQIENPDRIARADGGLSILRYRSICISCSERTNRWILLHGFVDRAKDLQGELMFAGEVLKEHLEMERHGS